MVLHCLQVPGTPNALAAFVMVSICDVTSVPNRRVAEEVVSGFVQLVLLQVSAPGRCTATTIESIFTCRNCFMCFLAAFVLLTWSSSFTVDHRLEVAPL